MRLKVVAIGKISDPAMRTLCDSYETRVNHYFDIAIDEIADSRRKGAAGDRATEIEGEAILGRLDERDRLVALSRTGKNVSSRGLSKMLDSWAIEARTVVFAVGGAEGLSQAVVDRADTTLSLSGLTFTHEIARLILLEQLYRAGTIFRGEPYHRGG